MNLKRQVAGKPLSAAQLNEMVFRHGNQLNSSAQAGEVSRFGANQRAMRDNKGWWGVVMTTGPLGSEDDYTDARYWIKSAIINNAAGSWTADAEADVADNPNAAGTESVQYVTATNLAEMLDDTHNLAADTPVWVQRFYGPDEQPYYVFSAGGAGGSLYAGSGTAANAKASKVYDNGTTNNVTLEKLVRVVSVGGTLRMCLSLADLYVYDPNTTLAAPLSDMLQVINSSGAKLCIKIATKCSDGSNVSALPLVWSSTDSKFIATGAEAL